MLAALPLVDYHPCMARRSVTPVELPSGEIARVLVLHGTEALLQREALAQLRRNAAAEHREVDVISFDGQSCTLADIMDELRSFGLMQQYKIVVVEAADSFVSAHRTVLERYVQNPVDHASLVLRCGRWYKGNLDKLIAKVGRIMKCEPMSSAAVQTRLVRSAREIHQRILDPRAAQILIDRIGLDVAQLENEVAKLALLVETGQTIDTDLIDQVTGRGSDEQAWMVQEAVLQAWAEGGKAAGARTIEKIRELVDLSGQPAILVAYFIADLIRKLNHAAMLRRQGTADGQIASQLKLWGRRQGLFWEAMSHLDEHQIVRLFDRIIDYDVRAKSGFGQSLRNIECFCAALDDRAR